MYEDKEDRILLENTNRTLNEQTTHLVELKKENEALKSQLRVYQKVAYLTFDDGPSANTSIILDTLKKENIKATFFVNGREKKEDIALYKRIISEGHVLGNHTFTHQYSTIYASPEQFIEDFNRLDAFLQKEVGIRPTLYRFPGGSNSRTAVSSEVHAELSKKGYTFFDWNIDSRDSSGGNPSKEFITNSVLEQAKGKKKALILFHDSLAKTHTAEALPGIIAALKKQGYVFDVLSPESFNRQFLLNKETLPK